jgi:pimeloyl-ACP methyl ester carboxylesterase
VLFLSGSGGSAEQYGLDLAKFYCTRGADVVAVNYRGFGGSTKDSKTLMGKATTTRIDASDITEDGLYSDAHAIFGWLMGEGVSPDNTIIHGYSLGGPVAAELTAHLAGKGIRVGGLVLESPMDSVREQAKQAAPTRGIGAFMADSGGVILDLRQHLRTLAKIDGFQDLAIHFMGGEGSAGDQLGLDVTKVDQDAAKMGFTNISSTTAKGADHMNSKKHAEVAERGANTYDNPAQSIDRLFKTAVPQVQSDAPSSTPSDPKTEQVVDQMMVVLSEDAQKEVVKTTEGGESESESTGG